MSLTPKTQIESIYPLSPMQQGMLFHTLYAPNSGVYFVQSVFTLSGNLNVPAFEQAWHRVVELHPILRTLFVWKNRQHPLQVVCKSVNLPWNNYDWRSNSSGKQEENLLAFLQAERERGFELDKAPLMRCTLIRVADNTYQFIWSHHHLLMDGWCLPIILKEVWAFYEAFDRGENLYLNAPPPYRNYITWLRQQDSEASQKFWRSTLAGFTAPTPLIVDKLVGNLSEQKAIYDEQNFKLSASLTDALKQLARQNHLTLNTLVQGAWALLLSRYSSESDVVFGATVSGRPPALLGVESMVGLFINTLPVRVQVSPETELLSWLKQLQVSQVEREQYSYSSLVEIQGVSDVPRNLPLFNSIVVFENYPLDSSLLEGKGSVEISNVRGFERTNYPLTVVVVPSGELSIQISYDTSRFDDNTIGRMLGHLQTLLSGIVANPRGRVCELPLLTQREKQQLLVEWNNTLAEYPQDKCIHQLFEEQVTRSPDAVAIVFEGEQLTYRELNARANQLAHYLQSLGVEPEVLVGICIERSLEMVVGLLGILKAGGAYVPLDPAYPSERLAFMLEDSCVAVLLTKAPEAEKLTLRSERVVYLDKGWEEIAQHSEKNPAIRVTHNKLAYVIYTSGSTGKPKGVLVAHQGVCNLITAQMQLFNMQPNSRVLQFASFSFDASVSEVLMALVPGATLIMATRQNLLPEPALIRLLREQAVTTITLSPSVLAVLPEKELPALQTIIVAGEACSSDLVARWASGRRFFNAYGPTEATVCATVALCTDGSQEPSIGRPIANTQIYLLDEKLRPVPIGVPGELYIGGDGLARGYLNRPDLTTEKFIPNPFSNKPGERLYKTGDLARYLPDGSIEFLGRIDNQVKIRGFRIELGEIESVLAKHSVVKETVVIVRENIIGSKQLIAYIVPNEELANTISDLRDFLKEQLPDYMVPSAFVTIDALPLTPNGKVDRRALPAPKYQPELELSFVAPRTPVEEILANIWASVLVFKEVGIYNNFFELGGHSLLAVQIISRIYEKFEIDLPLSCMFQSPTIAALSQLIDSTLSTNTQGDSSGKIPAVSPQARSQVLPLSFAQYYIWCLEHKFAGKCAANSSMALRLTGTLSHTVLEQSLNEIIRRHEILRTTFPIVEEQPTQKIAPSFTLPFQFIDLQYLCSQMSKEAEAHRIFKEAMNHEFDLTVAPPIKTILIQLSKEEHWLLIVMHHIITDGWSCGILLQELETLYSNLLLGKPSPLAELPLQYADFAIWQRKYFSEEVLSARLPYWQQHLANFPTSLDLFPAIQSTPDKPFANEHHFSLPVSLTSNIASLSHAYSVTPFIVLLTALNILLHKWSKQTDILVVGTIANRSTPEIERLLGCFISDLPLGIQLNYNQTAISLLEQVRKTVVEGLTYAIPSEKIWEPVENKLKILRTVTFVLVPATNWLGQALKCEELTISSDRGLWDEQHIPLELYAYYPNETNQAVEFHACYSTTTFTAEMIERFLKSYQAILDQLVRYPETIISDFVLIE